MGNDASGNVAWGIMLEDIQHWRDVAWGNKARRYLALKNNARGDISFFKLVFILIKIIFFKYVLYFYKQKNYF